MYLLYLHNRIIYQLCRDYQVLNYHLLQNLFDKVNNLEHREEQCWVMDDEEDDDLDRSQFIDNDLPEEVN